MILHNSFLWGRWEWAFSLPFQDIKSLGHIGIWEDNGHIVAVATYEDNLGYAYLLVDPKHNHLKSDMLKYAEENLSKDGKLQVNINNSDREFQQIAGSVGYKPTVHHENDALMDIDAITYSLP
ncbi:hypothetical protein SH2C18_47090 [Clostridium sediminicola]|uniref:hypothetical protein n=1 Tax=Clostridium sediminicola TaxID=3114879 RepID=UPI0031F2085C